MFVIGALAGVALALGAFGAGRRHWALRALSALVFVVSAAGLLVSAVFGGKGSGAWDVLIGGVLAFALASALSLVWWLAVAARLTAGDAGWRRRVAIWAGAAAVFGIGAAVAGIMRGGEEARAAAAETPAAAVESAPEAGPDCACGSGRFCTGPRGGRFCLAASGARRYSSD